jgi:hypothetical protein
MRRLLNDKAEAENTLSVMTTEMLFNLSNRTMSPKVQEMPNLNHLS